MKQYKNLINNEQGIALITTISLLLVIGVLGILAVTTSLRDITSSGISKEKKQAFYLAESGVSHAGEFLTNNLDKWGSYAYPASTPLLINTIESSNIISLPPEGSYSVTIQDGGNNRRKIISTGTANKGQSVVITAIFDGGFVAKYAVLTGGGIKVKDNAKLLGAGANLHSNEKISLEKNAYINGDVTSTGDIKIKGNNVNVIGSTTTPVASETFPRISPQDFKHETEYILTNSGFILDQTGNFIADLSNKKTLWNGWIYTGKEWRVKTTPTLNGSFYSELKVKTEYKYVAGNPVWEATIISEGEIEIRENVRITNYSGVTAKTQGLLFLSAKRFKADMKTGAELTGAIFTSAKVELKNDTTINGYIIGDGDPLIQANNTIEDNVTINFDTNFCQSCFSTTATLRTWKEGL